MKSRGALTSSSVILMPDPIIADPTLARPWKRASAAKRSVFSTLPSSRASLDEPIEMILMPTTDG